MRDRKRKSSEPAVRGEEDWNGEPDPGRAGGTPKTDLALELPTFDGAHCTASAAIDGEETGLKSPSL